MSSILWWIGLCRLFMRMSLESTISYFRWSFLSLYISHVVGYFGSYVTIWAAMRMFHEVNGWGMYEVAFLYSLDLLSYSLSQTFLQPFWRMDDLVVRGGLDEYLIRPINPLLLLIARHIQFGYVAHISLSIAAVLFVLSKLHIVWGLFEWGWFVFTVIGATLIQGGISIIPSCAAFWLTRADQLSGMLRWDLREYIRYPISIYPKSIRVILTVVVPFAFVNYYPSFHLLRKSDLTGFVQVMSWMTPVIGSLLMILAYFVWSAGVKRYESSGT